MCIYRFIFNVNFEFENLLIYFGYLFLCKVKVTCLITYNWTYNCLQDPSKLSSTVVDVLIHRLMGHNESISAVKVTVCYIKL